MERCSVPAGESRPGGRLPLVVGFFAPGEVRACARAAGAFFFAEMRLVAALIRFPIRSVHHPCGADKRNRVITSPPSAAAVDHCWRAVLAAVGSKVVGPVVLDRQLKSKITKGGKWLHGEQRHDLLFRDDSCRRSDLRDGDRKHDLVGRRPCRDGDNECDCRWHHHEPDF